ncbi:hypothetical protein BHE90_017022 [Fusarium euwallaceae]|uniref:LysM domain-containing protein n=1 Tax=Fusarium euwallaceae TaxID=1147111 RepID=A0A430KYS0_9HYPO|nr:hypothetical protein BHE90_017022 [Fusarium euwallaceae]
MFVMGWEEHGVDGENCDEKFLFAYYKQTVAGIYVGPGLGKQTVKSTLDALVGHIEDSTSISNKTVELCGSGRRSPQIIGVAMDTTGDLVAVQQAAMRWSKGTCAIKVEDGDSCTSLSVRCGIRGAELLKYNTKTNLCATLNEGDYVCRSAGDPYKPPAPEPNADGTCKAHFIENGDSCDTLARKNGVTVKDIEKWNKKKTSYTHIHWAFASIHPNTWKPIIKEGKKEWADFKNPKAKRTASFGGWADSTEPGEYNIIRLAIINNNREAIAANLASWAAHGGVQRSLDIHRDQCGHLVACECLFYVVDQSSH